MSEAKKVLQDFINEMKSYEIEWGTLMKKDFEKQYQMSVIRKD